MAAVGAEDLRVAPLDQVDGLRVLDLDVDPLPILVHALQRFALVKVERVRALVVGVTGPKTEQILLLKSQDLVIISQKHNL